MHSAFSTLCSNGGGRRGSDRCFPNGVLNSFRASISITTPDGFLRGTLSFSGGRVHIALSDGRVIAANGHQLFVYSPSTQVLGRQDMVPGGGGLGWLLTGFRTRVTGRTAHLTAENPNAQIREVRLVWDDNFLLKSLSIRRGEDSTMTIALSDIRRIENFPANLFNYKAPPGSRTVENPLNQSN